MATGLPQTIGAALFTQVTDLFEVAEPASPFVLARLKRDAEKLQAADAVEASVVKSAIAAYEWNYEEADHWVKNSLSLRKSAVNFHNAAVTMRALNDFVRASEYALMAAACAPSDADVILKSVNSLIIAGNFPEAYKLALPLRSSSEELVEICDQLEELFQAMKALNISGERILAEMITAGIVATENQIRISSAEHFISDDPDGGRSICIPLRFNGDISKELQLEADFSAKLAGDQQWDPLKLSIEFVHE